MGSHCVSGVVLGVVPDGGHSVGCRLSRFAYQVKRLGFAILVGVIACGGWESAHADFYRLQAEAFTIRSESEGIVAMSDAEAVGGSARRMYIENPNDIASAVMNLSRLQTGTQTLFIGVRARRLLGAPKLAITIDAIGGGQGAYYNISPDDTYDQGAGRWFTDTTEAVGYVVLGSLAVVNGTTYEFTLEESTYNDGALAFDEMILYTAEEGYATKAEAEMALNPTPPWITAGYTGSPPAIHYHWHATASGDTDKFHAWWFDATGTWQEDGDFTPAEQLDAIEQLTGRASTPPSGSGGNAYIYWEHPEAFGDPRSFPTFSEAALAEATYQILTPSKLSGFDQAALGAVWISENRFRVYGDPLGDVGYRLYLEMLAQEAGE